MGIPYIKKLYSEHLRDMQAWLREEEEYRERVEIFEEYCRNHGLDSENVTIGEMLNVKH